MVPIAFLPKMGTCISPPLLRGAPLCGSYIPSQSLVPTQTKAHRNDTVRIHPLPQISNTCPRG